MTRCRHSGQQVAEHRTQRKGARMSLWGNQAKDGFDL